MTEPTIPSKRNPGRIGYYDLPTEIRHKIAEYVFVPGDIQPMPKPCPDWLSHLPLYLLDKKKLTRVSIHKTRAWVFAQKVWPSRLAGVSSKQWAANPTQAPGLQLLATCKRAYYEYSIWLYGRNTFHLEPGFESLLDERARFHFATLQAVHWTMIQRLVIAFSFSDLTPHALATIEYNFHRLRNRAWDLLAGYRPWLVFYAWTLAYLARAWSLKIFWLVYQVYGKEIFLVGYHDGDGAAELILERSAHVTFAGNCMNATGLSDDLNPDIKRFVGENWSRVLPVLRAKVLEAFEGDPSRARSGGGGGGAWALSHCQKGVQRFKAWLVQQEGVERVMQRRPLPRNWVPRMR